jgi:hypothetical protein
MNVNPEQLPDWFFEKVGRFPFKQLSAGEQEALRPFLSELEYDEMHWAAAVLQCAELPESGPVPPLSYPVKAIRIWPWQVAAAVALLLAAASWWYGPVRVETQAPATEVVQVRDTVFLPGPERLVRDTLVRVLRQVQIRYVERGTCPEPMGEWLSEAPKEAPKEMLAQSSLQNRASGSSLAEDSLAKRFGFAGL